MQIVKMLTGHNSLDTAYVVHNYPYSGKRTDKYYWIESSQTYGDRLATVTVNPKNGRFNQVHPGTYCTFVFLFLDENEHVKHDEIPFNRSPKENQARFTEFLTQFDHTQLSKIQQNNIRQKIADNLLIDAAFEVRKLAEPALSHFKKWAMATSKLIKEWPFDQIAAYPNNVPLSGIAPDQTTSQAA
jgi:hypothetical protein